MTIIHFTLTHTDTNAQKNKTGLKKAKKKYKNLDTETENRGVKGAIVFRSSRTRKTRTNEEVDEGDDDNLLRSRIYSLSEDS